MLDVVFIFIALLALIFASVIDIKTKEIPNWLTYSLIAVGFSLRFLYAIFSNVWSFFYYAVLSFTAFFFLSMLIYYARQWGGGDAKLMAGLAAIFATSPAGFTDNFLNLSFIVTVFLNIIIIGAVYGLIISAILAIRNKERFLEGYKNLNSLKKTKLIKRTSLLATLLLIFLTVAVIEFPPFRNFFISIIISAQLLVYLYFLIKAVEHTCLYKVIPISDLKEGDWIVELPVKEKDSEHFNLGQFKRGSISQEKITALKSLNIQKVKIKEGLPFAPTFLMAFILTLFYGNLLYLLV